MEVYVERSFRLGGAVTTSFELSMDVNSVHHWTIPNAVRDLVANWLDNEKDSIWEWEEQRQTLTLTNRDTQLGRKIFLHGYSEKQGDPDTRGKYGDGLKSSIAVLLREGLKIHIYNGDKLWYPHQAYSETFQDQVICVEESLLDYDHSDYKVVITGITPYDMETIVRNTLEFQDIGEYHEVKMGKILMDDAHRGRVYCGGLYVDDFSDCKYGFDFHPEYFPLDRDRKSLDPFKVKWKTKDMWAEYINNSEDTPEKINNLVNDMVANEQSVEYIHYSDAPIETNNFLREAVEKVYEEKYEGKFVTSDTDEFAELKDAGNDVALVKNEGLVNIIKTTSSYKKVYAGKKKKKTTSELLDNFQNKHRKVFDKNTEMFYDYEDMKTEIESRK